MIYSLEFFLRDISTFFGYISFPQKTIRAFRSWTQIFDDENSSFFYLRAFKIVHLGDFVASKKFTSS